MITVVLMKSGTERTFESNDAGRVVALEYILEQKEGIRLRSPKSDTEYLTEALKKVRLPKVPELVE